jgi:hypothetical protein
MGKRSTSKHAASALAAGAHLRRLLVAVVCGGLVFVVSGLLLGSATGTTRLLLALGATVVVYAGLALAKARRAKGGSRRAASAVPFGEDEEPAEPSFVDGEIAIFGGGELDDTELVEDTEIVELADAQDVENAEDAEDAVHPQDEDEATHPAAEAAFPPVPPRVLEQLMQQAMAEQLAKEAAQEHSAEQVPDDLVLESTEPQHADAGVLVPDVVTHDLVPISSLHEARAEAEQQSLQRIRATVRGIGVRTGEDPVAVDVLARVVAAVDRLMVPDCSFARPALSETGPLLAAATAAPQEAGLPAQEATPLPAVPTMRPSDMPVTELSPAATPAASVPDEAPAMASALMPTTDTRPIDAVVVEDPELVLPIPAPPKPPPAPRGRRLRRNSVA